VFRPHAEQCLIKISQPTHTSQVSQKECGGSWAQITRQKHPGHIRQARKCLPERRNPNRPWWGRGWLRGNQVTQPAVLWDGVCGARENKFLRQVYLPVEEAIISSLQWQGEKPWAPALAQQPVCQGQLGQRVPGWRLAWSGSPIPHKPHIFPSLDLPRLEITRKMELLPKWQRHRADYESKCRSRPSDVSHVKVSMTTC
jgi:hypothetical protein